MFDCYTDIHVYNSNTIKYFPKIKDKRRYTEQSIRTNI